jgi:hypothetical protein
MPNKNFHIKASSNHYQHLKSHTILARILFTTQRRGRMKVSERERGLLPKIKIKTKMLVIMKRT